LAPAAALSAHDSLISQFGDRLRTDPLELTAMAHDASHYLLTPKAVLRASGVADVVQAMRLANQHNLPITFRAGGTSLSGQSVSDGLMIDTRQAFRQITVSSDGSQVTCGPGATIQAVNAALAPHGRILGPDPASKIAATVGGVVANNSSGMTCGTQFNTYQTLAALNYVLPSGTVIDSSQADADDQLRHLEPELYQTLATLGQQVKANPDWLAIIKAQYSMKNTMGYGLNSLVDFDRPVDMLTHLMVGSEGTLGFIAGATFNTLPIAGHVATALMVFPTLPAATDALPALLQAGAKVLELMDPASVKAAQKVARPADPINQVTNPAQTALLVELRATHQDELAASLSTMAALTPTLPLAHPATFTTDPTTRMALWASRNGLYTAVAGARAAGTTALLEDIAVPMEHLSHTCQELTRLTSTNGFAESVVFGHAKDGNIHFMLTLDLAQGDQLTRFEAFTEQMVDLVLDNGGTLKAEHGTGRIMAPYVRRQFGDPLYDVMCQIKQGCDPEGRLAPGVIITADPRAHMQHIKATAPVDPAFDRCVECGYCEPTCPSRDLTLTPRQRIVLLRNLAESRLDQKATGGRRPTTPSPAAGVDDPARSSPANAVSTPANARRRPSANERLAHDLAYQAVDTCAADSLCLVACPVNIDTGQIIKAQRALRHRPAVQTAGKFAARHWGGIVQVLRAGLRLVQVLPAPVLPALTNMGRRVLPTDWLPQVGTDLPGPGPTRRRPVSTVPVGPDTDQPVASVKPDVAAPLGNSPRQGANQAFKPAVPASPDTDQPSSLPLVEAVYFATCINSLFGPAELASQQTPGAAARGVGQALQQLAGLTGTSLITPPHLPALCCGTVWQSKGLTEGGQLMAKRVFGVLWRATEQGRLPVISDAASCSHSLSQLAKHLPPAQANLAERLEVLDSVSFVARHLAERLTVPEPLEAVAVHPNCSAVHLGAVEDLVTLAGMMAKSVFVPQAWGCCGFAGDRGLLHPELTASATQPEASELLAAELARAEAGAEHGGRFDAYVSANRTCELGMSRATGRPYRHILEVLAEVAMPR